MLLVPLNVSPVSGLSAYLQAVALDANLQVDTSNGVLLENDF